jgi:hypothetical protein
MSDKHTGEAENMRSGGPDESSGKRQNSPFRQLSEGGHHLSHAYKSPVAGINGNTVNHSYLNPMDHGSGMPKNLPPQVWQKANSIKPMSAQGSVGKTGPVKIS